jgi:hypothetical protein
MVLSLSLFIGIHIKDRFSILSCLSIYYSSAYGKPTSKGLVCFTRSGFHVTGSYSFGNTSQREMDGSNAYFNSSVLMRSGFHVTDGCIFVTPYRVRWMTINKKHFRKDILVFGNVLLSVAKGRTIAQDCNYGRFTFQISS